MNLSEEQIELLTQYMDGEIDETQMRYVAISKGWDDDEMFWAAESIYAFIVIGCFLLSCLAISILILGLLL